MIGVRKPYPGKFIKKQIVTAEEVRGHAANGLDRAGIAHAIGVTYNVLCKEIAKRFSLYEAEKRGQAEYVGTILNKRSVV